LLSFTVLTRHLLCITLLASPILPIRLLPFLSPVLLCIPLLPLISFSLPYPPLLSVPLLYCQSSEIPYNTLLFIPLLSVTAIPLQTCILQYSAVRTIPFQYCLYLSDKINSGSLLAGGIRISHG